MVVMVVMVTNDQAYDRLCQNLSELIVQVLCACTQLPCPLPLVPFGVFVNKTREATVLLLK